MVKFIILVLVAALWLAGRPSDAQTFEDGLRYYRAGDYDSARAIWLLLGVAGDRDSQYRYGSIYRHGKGVPQNNAVAVEWFLKAALQGQVNAQNSLGYMFSQGDGLPKDREKAKCWYLLAAEQGFPQAQDNLASLLSPLEEPEGSYHWTVRAARQGYTKAMAIVGWVEWQAGADKAEALMYLLLAAERGDLEAIEDIKRIRQDERANVKRLVTKFEGKAQEMAAAWEPVLEEPSATPPPVPDECLP